METLYVLWFVCIHPSTTHRHPQHTGIATSPRPANGHVPTPVGGLTDILDLLSDPTPPPAPEAPPPAPTPADPFAAGGPTLGPAAGEGIRPVGDVQEWFTRLCLRDSGVLYEDQHLQVGVKAQYTGSTGQLVLFLGNKGSQALTRLVCVVPPLPEVAIQQTPAPAVLEANQQIQVGFGGGGAGGVAWVGLFLFAHDA